MLERKNVVNRNILTRNTSIKLKAAFLLMVFSLNTVVGFACSVGVDMGYNTHHHEHGKKHSHKHSENHSSHQQSHLKKGTTFSASRSKDDCCSNDVARFTLLDKSVTDNSIHLQVPVFLLAFTSTFLPQADDAPALAVNSRFQFVRRSCFLNDTDVRIAIQSFQI